MKCPNCLKDVPADALFCPACGEKIIIQKPKNKAKTEEKEPELKKSEGLSKGDIEKRLKITNGILAIVLVVLGLMILGVIEPLNVNKADESQETLVKSVEQEALETDILTVVITKDDNVKMLRCSGYPTENLKAGETYVLGELSEEFMPIQNIYAYMINNNDICNIRLDIKDGVVSITPKADISVKTGVNIQVIYM